jgi:hypothetical protein
LGIIGHLRAEHGELLAEVGEAGSYPPETQGNSSRKQRLLELVLSEQVPPTEFERQPVSAVPLSAPKGSMAEALARMYHPVLHNPRAPLMAQVRRMMVGFMKSRVGACAMVRVKRMALWKSGRWEDCLSCAHGCFLCSLSVFETKIKVDGFGENPSS